MELRFHKCLWGFESQPLPTLLDRIKRAGYEGFECPISQLKDQADAGTRAGLEYVGMCFPTSEDQFAQDLETALALGAVMLNVHAGAGYWPFERGAKFFEAALKRVEKVKIPVCFETHRGRLLYEPQSTKAYLDRFPDLRITADFSHWTCVCESLLQGQDEAVELAIQRTIYIHARVGHEEGPQVSDPRAPEWQNQVNAHLGWWKRIAQSAKSRGQSVLRVDPEFGPPNYMPTLPHTHQPVADLWNTCLWMRDRVKQELSGI